MPDYGGFCRSLQRAVFYIESDAWCVERRLNGNKDRVRGQGRRKENSWEATAIIQVKDGSGLDLGVALQMAEWSTSGYPVK